MADSQLRARPGKSKGKSPRADSDIDDILQKPPKVPSSYNSFVYTVTARSGPSRADGSILVRMRVRRMRRGKLVDSRLQ